MTSLKKNKTKQKVIDAASILFFQKGFHGTSVRDIAEEASVNVSLISYYFKSKQGLFEFAVIDYYETYLRVLEDSLQNDINTSALARLKNLIVVSLHFKQQNIQLTCTLQRELTLDSTFVREVSVTYIAKENHLLKGALDEVIREYNVKKKSRSFMLMQLKGMLITPYVLYNEWKPHVVGEKSHENFVRDYSKTIYEWLEFVIERTKEKTL